jgi:exodeoxyribonuclease V beta subunit
MVDEFQDTSPDQYRIFDLLYRVADNDPAHGLFLIGDPKQSIYGFRGADIHSYLAARAPPKGATTSSAPTTARPRAGGGGQPAVPACRRPWRAPGLRGRRLPLPRGDVNPLPFDAVDGAGAAQELVGVDGPYQALAVCSTARDDLRADDYRDFFATTAPSISSRC